MISIGFPNMLTNSSTILYNDREATVSNLKLLLMSDKRSLLGDPYFGTNLKTMLFEQNSAVLRDIVIDDIYTSIMTFMPQIQLTRKDIDVVLDDTSVEITISCLNRINYKTDMYTIRITDADYINGK